MKGPNERNQRGVRSWVCSLGCPREQQQGAGLQWDSAGSMDHKSPTGLLLVEDLFQWRCNAVSIASLASVPGFKAQKLAVFQLLLGKLFL